MMITAGQQMAINFAQGPIGMPGMAAWTLRDVDGAYLEMVYNDDPAIGFIVAPAGAINTATEAAIREAAGLSDDEHPVVIIAVHGETVTANLAGPIVIDTEGNARQVVVEDDRLPLRHPIDVGGMR